MAAYLRQLDDDKLSILYLTATELRSVLLGILFAERIASAEAVFRLAFVRSWSSRSNGEPMRRQLCGKKM